MTDLFESNYTESDKKEDMKILHSMGYAQELERRMPVFSNFAISFSIICILSGGINSLAQATAGGRRRLDRHRLADRLPHLRRVRAGDGPDRVVLSDRRRALSLELYSREPLYRLADGVAQSARPDHSSRRDQCRHVGIFFRRDRTLVPCDQRRHDRRGGVSQSDHLHGADHRPPGADQSLRHQVDGEADGFLRLPHLRRDDRADAGLFRLRRTLGFHAAVDVR